MLDLATNDTSLTDFCFWSLFDSWAGLFSFERRSARACALLSLAAAADPIDMRETCSLSGVIGMLDSIIMELLVSSVVVVGLKLAVKFCAFDSSSDEVQCLAKIFMNWPRDSAGAPVWACGFFLDKLLEGDTLILSLSFESDPSLPLGTLAARSE